MGGLQKERKWEIEREFLAFYLRSKYRRRRTRFQTTTRYGSRKWKEEEYSVTCGKLRKTTSPANRSYLYIRPICLLWYKVHFHQFFLHLLPHHTPKTGKFTLIRSYTARRKKNYHTLKRVQEKPNMSRQEHKKIIKAQLGTSLRHDALYQMELWSNYIKGSFLIYKLRWI